MSHMDQSSANEGSRGTCRQEQVERVSVDFSSTSCALAYRVDDAPFEMHLGDSLSLHCRTDGIGSVAERGVKEHQLFASLPHV